MLGLHGLDFFIFEQHSLDLIVIKHHMLSFRDIWSEVLKVLRLIMIVNRLLCGWQDSLGRI